MPVRVEAVAALGQCPSRAVDARLLAWVDDGAQPVPVRDRALAAYGERPGAEVAVLARFAAWRGQAFSDDVALRLAIRAATVLGARGAAMAGLGRLAMAQRDWEKARRVYRSLVLQNLDADAGVTKADVYYALGVIHVELGEGPKAKGMFQRGLEMDPADQRLKDALAKLAGTA